MAVLRIGRAIKITGERLHEEGDKVALAKEKILFERGKMAEEMEFVCHEVDETGHGCCVCFVDGGGKGRGISVLELACVGFRVLLDPGGVGAGGANEIEGFADQEDALGEVGGDDCGDE